MAYITLTTLRLAKLPARGPPVLRKMYVIFEIGLLLTCGDLDL